MRLEGKARTHLILLSYSYSWVGAEWQSECAHSTQCRERDGAAGKTRYVWYQRDVLMEGLWRAWMGCGYGRGRSIRRGELAAKSVRGAETVHEQARRRTAPCPGVVGEGLAVEQAGGSARVSNLV